MAAWRRLQEQRQVLHPEGQGHQDVTVKETGTFKGDTKGWQAIQVLSPRAATSGKKYFSVSCGNDWTVLNPPHKHRTSAQVWVDEDNCQATLIGRITTSGPRWVRLPVGRQRPRRRQRRRPRLRFA